MTAPAALAAIACTVTDDIEGNGTLIVCGRTVPVGPLLAHMMAACQPLQDDLLRLTAQPIGLTRSYPYGPAGEYPHASFDLDLVIAAGLPMLVVAYGNETFSLDFDYVGGDAIETVEFDTTSDEQAIDWCSATSLAITLRDRNGDAPTVPLHETEAEPGELAPWHLTGTVWEAHLDQGMQRAALRKAA